MHIDERANTSSHETHETYDLFHLPTHPFFYNIYPPYTLYGGTLFVFLNSPSRTLPQLLVRLQQAVCLYIPGFHTFYGGHTICFFSELTQ